MAGHSDNLAANKHEEYQGMLLMYLADELSPADRALMEQKLQSDLVLREELDELRSSVGVYERTMQALDAAPPPVPHEASVQRSGRLMRQWAARRLAEPPKVKAPQPVLPRWAYPMAMAAAMLITVIIWGLNRHGQSIEQKLRADELAAKNDDQDGSSDALEQLSIDQQAALLGDAPTGETNTNATGALDDADRTIAALKNNSDDLDGSIFGATESTTPDVPPGAREDMQ